MLELRCLSGAASAVLGILTLALFVPVATAAGEHARQSSATDRLARAEINARALLGGIPEHGDALGRENAPLTLCWFGDLQSPVTATFDQDVLPSLIRRWVRRGRLRIEYRSLETSTQEYAEFKREQVAALAAGSSGRMWYFVQLFYHDQPAGARKYATWSFLERLARHTPGLPVRRWRREQSNPRYTEQLDRDLVLAEQNEIEGTPAFLLGHTGGLLNRLDFTTNEDPAGFERSMRTALRP